MKRTLLTIKISGRLTVRLLFGLAKSSKKKASVEDNNSTQDMKMAEELISLFSNIVEKLKIPDYNEINPMAEWITNPTLRAMLEYRRHLSVTIIENLNIWSHFQFTLVSVDELLKAIKKLNAGKIVQSTDVPVKILKGNADVFVDSSRFNLTINSCNFPSILKRANAASIFKKVIMIPRKLLS